MMEHGQEFTLDSQHRLSAVGPVLMQPIIHFDIKPENSEWSLCLSGYWIATYINSLALASKSSTRSDTSL
jgi:hypothetical protein